MKRTRRSAGRSFGHSFRPEPLAVVLAVALLMTLAACDPKKPDPDRLPKPKSESSQPAG